MADLDAAIEWYARLLGGPPDMTPNEIERTWKLTDEIQVISEAVRKAVFTDPEGNQIGFGQAG